MYGRRRRLAQSGGWARCRARQRLRGWRQPQQRSAGGWRAGAGGGGGLAASWLWSRSSVRSTRGNAGARKPGEDQLPRGGHDAPCRGDIRARRARCTLSVRGDGPCIAAGRCEFCGLTRWARASAYRPCQPNAAGSVQLRREREGRAPAGGLRDGGRCARPAEWRRRCRVAAWRRATSAEAVPQRPVRRGTADSRCRRLGRYRATRDR